MEKVEDLLFKDDFLKLDDPASEHTYDHEVRICQGERRKIFPSGFNTN